MSLETNLTENLFVVGDTVECLKSTLFLDGSRHLKGGRYTVDQSTLYYFRVCAKDYRLFSRPTLEPKEVMLLKHSIKLLEDQLSALKNKAQRTLHNDILKSQIKALEFALKKLGELS